MKSAYTAERLLLTPDEAAKALAICRAKIYELMRAGELRSIRIGASRRVPVEALREFIEAASADEE